MQLDLSSVMLQWAAGGMLFCWVTTRRREVGLGYGWLLRGTYATFAAIGVFAGIANDDRGAGATTRDVFGAVLALAAFGALAVSVARRDAGVRGQTERRAARAGRVAAMLHREPAPGAPSAVDLAPSTREFPPVLDLVAALAGFVAVLAAAEVAGGDYALSAARLVVGALFLGAITDAMLLGHWYLVQPGLARDPIRELVLWAAVIWPFEVALLLVPTGMVSVLDGSIDDGYSGLIGVMWIVCALTTLALLGVTWLALKERYYSAVMAATGLLYLAILTAFGTDVMARAVLS